MVRQMAKKKKNQSPNKNHYLEASQPARVFSVHLKGPLVGRQALAFSEARAIRKLLSLRSLGFSAASQAISQLDLCLDRVLPRLAEVVCSEAPVAQQQQVYSGQSHRQVDLSSEVHLRAAACSAMPTKGQVSSVESNQVSLPKRRIVMMTKNKKERNRLLLTVMTKRK